LSNNDRCLKFLVESSLYPNIAGHSCMEAWRGSLFLPNIKRFGKNYL
jgi:hypothetical protein